MGLSELTLFGGSLWRDASLKQSRNGKSEVAYFGGLLWREESCVYMSEVTFLGGSLRR